MLTLVIVRCRGTASCNALIVAYQYVLARTVVSAATKRTRLMADLPFIHGKLFDGFASLTIRGLLGGGASPSPSVVFVSPPSGRGRVPGPRARASLPPFGVHRDVH
jgi:hypothetical protein